MIRNMNNVVLSLSLYESLYLEETGLFVMGITRSRVNANRLKT